MKCEITNLGCKYMKECIDARDNLTLDPMFKSLFDTDYELLQLEFGLKNVVRKENIGVDEIKALTKKYNAYHSLIFSYWKKIDYTGSRTDELRFNIAFSKKPEDNRQLIRYTHNPKKNIRNKKCGVLLGYPKCCINEYNDNEVRSGIHIEFFWQKNFLSQKKLCPLIYNLVGFNSHFPCSPKCKHTLSRSLVILDYINQKYGIKTIRTFFSLTHHFIEIMKNNPDIYATRPFTENMKDFRAYCVDFF